MPGWKTSITGCRAFEDLPQPAKDYVQKIEQLLGKEDGMGRDGIGRTRWDRTGQYGKGRTRWDRTGQINTG